MESIGELEQLGQFVLDYLFSALQVDKAWSVREQSGWTWWAGELAQTVRYEIVKAREYQMVRVHISTDLYRDVLRSPKIEARLGAMNMLATLSAMILDSQTSTISLHCSAYLRPENIGFL